MERALYDIRGEPVAYLADDGTRTICLRNGRAVAYIDEGLNCHGWNGRYLGWMEDGILLDVQGRPVGFLKPRGPGSSWSGPGRCVAPVKPPKQAKGLPVPRPARRSQSSGAALAEFLKAGAVDPIGVPHGPSGPPGSWERDLASECGTEPVPSLSAQAGSQAPASNLEWRD